jgi:hypothetical protein
LFPLPLASVTNLLMLKEPLASVTRFDFDSAAKLQIMVHATILSSFLVTSYYLISVAFVHSGGCYHVHSLLPFPFSPIQLSCLDLLNY